VWPGSVNGPPPGMRKSVPSSAKQTHSDGDRPPGEGASVATGPDDGGIAGEYDARPLRYGKLKRVGVYRQSHSSVQSPQRADMIKMTVRYDDRRRPRV
jgi:hypothetical protein